MTPDLDALIEQHTRRELALRGSGRVASRTSFDGPLPDAEASRNRPMLLWPDQRHLIPTRCHHCGAGSANFDADLPYAEQKLGSVTCMLCSRIVVNLKDAGTRPLPRMPARYERMARLPCVVCELRPRADSRRLCDPCNNARKKTVAAERLCDACGLVPPTAGRRQCAGCVMARWRGQKRAAEVQA